MDGAEETLSGLFEQGYFGETGKKIYFGTAEGIYNSLSKTWSFISSDAWKAQTWKNASAGLNKLADITAGNINGSNNQLAYNAIQPKVNNFKKEVVDGDAYSRSKYTSEIFTDAATAYLGSKGLAGLKAITKAPKLFFRGTTVGFSGSAGTVRTGVVPASIDPAVATVFATESSQFGNGVVYIASEAEVTGLKSIEGNVLKSVEAEIGFETTTEEFAKRSGINITAEQSRGILKKLGINVPSQITKSQITDILKNLPKLTSEQIQAYYKEALNISSKPK